MDAERLHTIAEQSPAVNKIYQRLIEAARRHAERGEFDMVFRLPGPRVEQGRDSIKDAILTRLSEEGFSVEALDRNRHKISW